MCSGWIKLLKPLRVLYEAVHCLIEHPIALKDPCILPFRKLETYQLGRCVFLHKQTVYKLCDNDFSQSLFAKS